MICFVSPDALNVIDASTECCAYCGKSLASANRVFLYIPAARAQDFMRQYGLELVGLQEVIASYPRIARAFWDMHDSSFCSRNEAYGRQAPKINADKPTEPLKACASETG